MPATSRTAQTALLFPFCMSPDFLRPRYLKTAADDTPPQTPPVILLSLFLAPFQEVPKEAYM